MNAPQFDDFQDSQQPATQVATQIDGQPTTGTTAQPPAQNTYACLQPCNQTMKVTRIELMRPKINYSVGRNPRCDIHFTGMKISFNHCIISWNGREDKSALVSVQDSSTNGTWINGVRLEKGHSQVLRDGNEIAFGAPHAAKESDDDYRFIFRLFTGQAATGLNAHYDLAYELGHGSFATVMKALHRASGEWFAVKIIHGSKIRGGDDARLQSFMREISILESLDHENICSLKERFFDESRGDENIYLVLELVEGGDLLDYIVAEDGLSEERAKDITRQVCNAMAYIHSKGITHRDLKPENILLTADKSVAKVADFGLAKIVDHLTMLRTMCGTPSYLAPEVVNPIGGEGHGYDHLVDSWSVGVIVFSMLTNCTPFIEDDQLPMSERIKKRTIEWGCLDGQGKRPRCTREAKNFIERLLDDTPGTRMSLTEALDHPWLTDRHMDSQPEDSYSQQSADQHALASDVSMLTSFPSSPPFTPAPSQRLARRADVNARAAEEQEMARQKAESESSRGTSPGVGEKRGREFTGNGYAGNGAPSEDAAMEDDDGPLGAVRSPAKRGRMDVDESGGAGRKTRAPASRTTRASAVPPSVEAEPRRSPRVTKTAARR
ncbi:Pkinase-domain-containing protein [Peniophora sp. CONT]|nr:Pkinase-domain-containing protein [Peniophora sp. CONT]